MHPNTRQLAAYLDQALDQTTQAELRVHVLTCTRCAAALKQLQADERRIATSLDGPAPDLRRTIQARLQRRRAVSRATLALAGGLVLLLLAMLVGPASTTVGYLPSRLLVLDRQGARVLELDSESGALVGQHATGGVPTALSYDPRGDRLYLLTSGGLTALAPTTLATLGHWRAPAGWGSPAAMALDSRRALLYISWPEAGLVTRLDGTTLTETARFSAGQRPGALALTPDGRWLFTVDGGADTLWSISLPTGESQTRRMPTLAGQRSWLSADAQWLTILSGGQAPTLLRYDWRSGQLAPPQALPAGPAVQDLLAGEGWLAIARGDGARGGVLLVDRATLLQREQLDADYDQHQLVAGPNGALFGLNWLHRSISRYQLGTASPRWQVNLAGSMPWDGVFLPGRWWLRAPR